MSVPRYVAAACPPRLLFCRRAPPPPPPQVSTVAFFIAIAAVIYSTIDAGTASRDMFGSGRKHEAGGLDEPELPYRPVRRARLPGCGAHQAVCAHSLHGPWAMPCRCSTRNTLRNAHVPSYLGRLPARSWHCPSPAATWHATYDVGAGMAYELRDSLA